MKVGVLSSALSDLPLGEALDLLQELKVDAVEIGTGCYPGSPHCNLPELLESPTAVDAYLREFELRGLTISALSCHGNPISPDEAQAQRDSQVFDDTVRLAPKLGVGVVNCFSGLPGDCEGGRVPIWVTRPWPPEHSDLLEKQWDQVIIPHWKKANTHATEHGVKIGLELHPNMAVFNPATLHRLRGEAGKAIGVNWDPSHFWGMGADPLQVLRALKGCVWHAHAKDARLLPAAGVNGLFGAVPMDDLEASPWTFCTVGTGHGLEWWHQHSAELRTVEYDFVLSLEHEDGLMSPSEGLRKGVSALHATVIRDKPGDLRWLRN